MILAENRIVINFQELWTSRSFRARIFLALFPTTIATVVGHYAFDRQHPYTFIKEDSFIVPPEGKGGDQITVHWRVKKHRMCPGTVERLLVDPRTGVVIAAYDPAMATENGADIGGGYLRKTFMIPRNIQTGTIGYRAKLTYQCNWLQQMWPAISIRYDTPTLLFHVEE